MYFKKVLKSKRILIPIVDLISVFLSAFLGIWVQDGDFTMSKHQLIWAFINAALILIIYSFFRTYSLSFAGISVFDAMRISLAAWTLGCFNVIFVLFFGKAFTVGYRAVVVFTVFVFIG